MCVTSPLPDDKKKPRLDPHYMAAEIAGLGSMTGRQMSECLVFEDSVSGLHAASAAGAEAVMDRWGNEHTASGRAPHSTPIPDFGFTLADVSRIMIERY